MRKYLSSRNLLFGILILAFVLRFWGAWNQDMIGDESADSFRAVGYIDFLGTSFQTQPIEWYKDTVLPFWSKLSFHDLPPLTILIQHVFFSVFGDSILVARLPAILLGVGAVFLIYLLTNNLFLEYFKFDKKAGESFALLTAFIFAVNGAMVGIFRTSLLEPILLFFLLLNIYFFFKFLESAGRRTHYWWLFGITLGLIALTKYTGAFILPVYFFYALLTKRAIFKDWRLYGSLVIAILLLSPVIVYNIYLYQARGHFDLQIAYFLGQNTPEWSGSLGKIQSPFSDIGKNLKDSYGISGLLGIIFGLALMAYGAYKTSRFIKLDRAFLFPLIYLLFITLLFIKIGSAHRFLSLYGFPFVILLALTIYYFWNQPKWEYLFKFAAIILIIFELGHSISSNFIKMPDYGIAKLDRYFEEEFRGKESAVIPDSGNPHLDKVIQKFAAKKSEKKPALFMIVYNDNIALSTIEWIFYRRFFYHSIPALFVENFNKVLSLQGPDYFKGFDIYFVQSVANTLLNPFKTEKTAGLEFENSLKNQGLGPIKIIYGQKNLPMFKIYKFSL